MWRFLVVLPVAVLLSFMVFVAMAWLVRTPNNEAEPMAVKAVSFIVSEPDDRLVRRKRRLPEPVPLLPEPQLSDTVALRSPPQAPHQALAAFPIGQIPIEAVDVHVSVANTPSVLISPQVPMSDQVSSSQQALPLYRVEPRYPDKARQRRADGYVIIQFNIDVHGSPVELEVIEAKPKRLFEREAIEALKQWKYQPKLEQGQAAVQIGKVVKLEFKYPK